MFYYAFIDQDVDVWVRIDDNLGQLPRVYIDLDDVRRQTRGSIRSLYFANRLILHIVLLYISTDLLISFISLLWFTYCIWFAYNSNYCIILVILINKTHEKKNSIRRQEQKKRIGIEKMLHKTALHFELPQIADDRAIVQLRIYAVHDGPAHLPVSKIKHKVSVWVVLKNVRGGWACMCTGIQQIRQCDQIDECEVPLNSQSKYWEVIVSVCSVLEHYLKFYLFCF